MNCVTFLIDQINQPHAHHADNTGANNAPRHTGRCSLFTAH